MPPYVEVVGISGHWCIRAAHTVQGASTARDAGASTARDAGQGEKPLPSKAQDDADRYNVINKIEEAVDDGGEHSVKIKIIEREVDDAEGRDVDAEGREQKAADDVGEHNVKIEKEVDDAECRDNKIGRRKCNPWLPAYAGAGVKRLKRTLEAGQPRTCSPSD